MSRPRIDPSWHRVLAAEFDDPYMDALRTFLQEEERAGHAVFPPRRNIFRAFDLVPFEAVRVVIVGQDPYHGPGQAHGLSFSVPEGVRIPPSLANVYKEIQDELGGTIPRSGNLESWARQGVLLLNATLTVRAGEAGSHRGHGWERFTDAAIRALGSREQETIFLLWGRHAKEKRRLIDTTRHLVLTAAHPSPLSAHNGFFGCGHFARVNQRLVERGEDPITWLPA